MCVCVVGVCVKSNLTPGASVHPENTVTYSAGNRGQKFVGFSLRSKVMASFALHILRSTAVKFRALFRRQSLVKVLKRLKIG